jgi:hypothetical protein
MNECPEKLDVKCLSQRSKSKIETDNYVIV